MTVQPRNTDTTAPRASSAVLRVARYAVFRAALLLVMVGAGIFLGIVVINYGGYIDQITQAGIDEAANGMSLGMRDMPEQQRNEAIRQAKWEMEEKAGLHQPFLSRCARWWVQAVTFNWGQTDFRQAIGIGTSVRQDVSRIILDRIPNTLLLAGSANLLLFFGSLFLALSLSRQHGSWLDRLIITLSPISAIPNWVYGILLTVVVAGELRLLPFGGMFDEFPPATPIGYVPIVLKHMILPVAAIFLSAFFQTVYAWRTYFLIHSGEDYVEMARAKGLPGAMIERRYVLRPALPYTITSFALMLIGFWQGVLVLELFFRWPGIGQLFIQAIRGNDRWVSIGLIVMFAFLLAISILVLDVLYAIVDPRVRIGGGRQSRQPAAGRRRIPFWKKPDRLAQPRPVVQPGWLLSPPAEKIERRRPRVGLAARLHELGSAVRDILRYPSAIAGSAVIVGLIGVAIYTLVTIPYSQAVYQWRPQTAEKYYLPRNAMPAWTNLFRKEPLPETIIQNTRDGTAVKTVRTGSQGANTVTISFTLDYPSAGFPQDMAVNFSPTYSVKKPFVTLSWATPDGRVLKLGGFSIASGQTFLLSQDLPRKLLDAYDVRQAGFMAGEGGNPATEILFANPIGRTIEPLKGTYTLRVDGLTFEQNAGIDAELVLWGQVYGLAGTDNMRRDLMVALLWGTPVALAFGLLGALATSLLSMTLAALGAWFGGWVDDLVQRLTEINMILPALPIAIMVFYLYSHSIWVILGVMVLLGVLGSAIKNYRAAFLQIKEAPYVEAAQAYGAGSWRIIRHYLVPRIVPLLVPQLVILVPTYVFFEATLAYLGISDPNLPTWGKVVYDALTAGAYAGYYYWVLEPIGLMMLTALAFAMVGFALDAILNPRLRSQ